MAVRYFADDAGLDAFLQQASPVTALGDVPGDHVFIGVLEDSTGELKPDRGGRIGMEHYDRLAALAASDEPPEFRLRHIALRDCEGFTGRG